MQFRYEYFPFICQQIAAVFKIGNSKELPPIPDHLSEHCKDFIMKCLQRDPSHRPTSVELLQHPFIQNGISLEKSVAPNALEHLAAISCRPKPKVPPEYCYSHFNFSSKLPCLLSNSKLLYLSSVNFICLCNYMHQKLVCFRTSDAFCLYIHCCQIVHMKFRVFIIYWA